MNSQFFIQIVFFCCLFMGYFGFAQKSDSSAYVRVIIVQPGKETYLLISKTVKKQRSDYNISEYNKETGEKLKEKRVSDSDSLFTAFTNLYAYLLRKHKKLQLNIVTYQCFVPCKVEDDARFFDIALFVNNKLIKSSDFNESKNRIWKTHPCLYRGIKKRINKAEKEAYGYLN